MKRYRSTKSLLATIAAAMLAIAASWSPARAQDTYPSRQITLIAPYPPGGVVDMTARMLAEGLKEKFNQSAIVLNKAGANGMIGLTDLVKAEPDGYTLLLNNDGGLGIPPAVDPNFKFDPMKDYTPIAQVVQHGWMFIVNSGIPAKTMQEFIAYAKARPGELTFGTPGIATLPHIATELFMLRAGVKMVHVPYKGAAPALTDLIAGTVKACRPHWGKSATSASKSSPCSTASGSRNCRTCQPCRKADFRISSSPVGSACSARPGFPPRSATRSAKPWLRSSSNRGSRKNSAASASNRSAATRRRLANSIMRTSPAGRHSRTRMGSSFHSDGGRSKR